ncbi:hypothetical protein BU14_0256s0005 [Porphyra umbilicalis]|uniref:Uncharacterized protein n=1 Tax=Porphyra umbilicalis TaxID=2786 RepID=A0A1X6P2E7_PORUM|nr:hypothetical protein BU14_0256s0005 [Porphyra umbilicalis]|eukprot:OSX75052.1 hypothetical protein BU14_0256s0005 [Porphyra umbilicalis]
MLAHGGRTVGAAAVSAAARRAGRGRGAGRQQKGRAGRPRRVATSSDREGKTAGKEILRSATRTHCRRRMGCYGGTQSRRCRGRRPVGCGWSAPQVATAHGVGERGWRCQPCP